MQIEDLKNEIGKFIFSDEIIKQSNEKFIDNIINDKYFEELEKKLIKTFCFYNKRFRNKVLKNVN
jgi:hypothetical protein